MTYFNCFYLKKFNNFIFLHFLFLFTICFFPYVNGDQLHIDANNNVIKITVAWSRADIEIEKSKNILLNSFLKAYENIPLQQLDAEFKSRKDLKNYYLNIFKERIQAFDAGYILWVQAYVNDELAGWATFELDLLEENSGYMDILVISPQYQKMGLGKCLTFSICSNDLYPDLNAITLFVRKNNLNAILFYKNLGFFETKYNIEYHPLFISMKINLTKKS